MNPIYTFTEEYEKEMAVANRQFEIAMTEAAMMAENTARQLRVNAALSELKVMEESGTASDLADLLLEAGEEAAQENRGILAKVFTAIGNFFTRLFNSIQKIFTGKNTAKYNELIQKNTKVQVDSTTPKLMEALQQALPQLDQAGQDDGTFVKKIVGIVGGGAAAAGALFAIWKKTKKFRNDEEAESTVTVDAKTAISWKNTLADHFKKLGEFFTSKGHVKPVMTDGQGNPVDNQQQKTDAKVRKQQERGKTVDSKDPNGSRAKITASAGTAAADVRNDTAENMFGDSFVGMYNMFEAGESGGITYQTVLGFLQSMCSAAIKQITSALNKAIGAVSTAAKGVVNKVTGNNQQTGQDPQPGQTSSFLGEENMEESGSDVDPIDAMLSGLALGGYHG